MKAKILKPTVDKYRVTLPVVGEEFTQTKYKPSDSYDWKDFLDASDFQTVSVDNFYHAPLNNVFHHLKPGLKVEVPNRDYENHQHANSLGGVYWVAYIIKIAGYRALMRYEGYSNDSSHDFWMGFCSKDLHPVGWCAATGKPLVPPKSLQDAQDDWKAFLIKRLTGARTLPTDWQDKVKAAVTNSPLKVGMRLEVIDTLHPERLLPAVIKQVVAGRLFCVASEKDLPAKGENKKQEQQEYIPEDPKQTSSSGRHGSAKDESNDENEEELQELWYGNTSPHIFPVGFALRVGYGLHANEQYKNHCAKIIESDPEGLGEGDHYDPVDSRPQMFTPFFQEPLASEAKTKEHEAGSEMENNLQKLTSWQASMKLECIDPLEMNKICVATVSKVLNKDYLKITFDGTEEDDTFIFHKDSPYLFPVGFCKSNGIDLRPPPGHEKFNWAQYLKETNSTGAFDSLCKVTASDNTNAFEINCRLEAVDVMDSTLVCSASIVEKKAGSLLKIRFDGWDSTYDQWADYRSPDLNPVGWAETVGYKLEAPNQEQLSTSQSGKKRSSEVPAVAPTSTKKGKK